MTPKEIFLELLKPDGRPERQLDQYEALNMVLYDPINIYLRGNRVRGTVSKDRWGTTIDFPADAPGPMPHVTEETKVIKDITHWQDYVHVPDLASNTAEGWAECREKAASLDPNGEKLLTGFMGTGIFEQCHFLIPFADVLTYLYEYPKEMHDLIDCILQYRLEYVKLLIDGLHPEVIFSHDDWGAKDALFFKPEMWREFFKEPYRQFYGYIRSRGVIAIHHADSYLVPILDDMAEIGIQVWQGALPENDIPKQLRRLNGKLVLMGGIGASIDRADATEEEIRTYVRRTLRENCPEGHYIPSITYGLAGAVYPQVDPLIDDEIAKYNEEAHFPRRRDPEPHKMRQSAAALSSDKALGVDSAGESGTAAETRPDILLQIAEALRKGRRPRVTKLTREALSQGIPAQEILTEGLVTGMTEVGDDFTANRIFVPEMLMAAQCMNAATEILKPALTGSSQEKPKGTVCLGTVKGDLHDIGKNLVKIMMEGMGLTVIDLGVDVTAKQFVDAAIEQHCDIIACSALLTTSMDEMRNVVSEAIKRGIRDKVKILIGGAPIDQDFCDEIHADCYTDDAAAAARAAVAMVSGD